ncbi:hypothetical protein J6590_057009, partial [Homalodisca vitripennis]
VDLLFLHGVRGQLSDDTMRVSSTHMMHSQKRLIPEGTSCVNSMKLTGPKTEPFGTHLETVKVDDRTLQGSPSLELAIPSIARRPVL